MTIQETAEKLGVNPDELLAFYRGVGPKPEPLTDQPESSEGPRMAPPGAETDSGLPDTPERGPECPECGFEAQTQGGLATHQRAKHQ